jgi:hypothetical protein
MRNYKLEDRSYRHRIKWTRGLLPSIYIGAGATGKIMKRRVG